MLPFFAVNLYQSFFFIDFLLEDSDYSVMSYVRLAFVGGVK
jgi:hypothetical protein